MSLILRNWWVSVERILSASDVFCELVLQMRMSRNKYEGLFFGKNETSHPFCLGGAALDFSRRPVEMSLLFSFFPLDVQLIVFLYCRLIPSVVPRQVDVKHTVSLITKSQIGKQTGYRITKSQSDRCALAKWNLNTTARAPEITKVGMLSLHLNLLTDSRCSAIP